MKKFFKKEIKEKGTGAKGVLKTLSQDSRRRQGNEDAREKYAKRKPSDDSRSERSSPRKSFEDRGNERPESSFNDDKSRRGTSDRNERKPYERSAPRKSPDSYRDGNGDDRPKRTYGSSESLRGPQGTTGDRKPYERSAPRKSPDSYRDGDRDDRPKRTYGSGNALRGPQGTTGDRKPYERSAPRKSPDSYRDGDGEDRPKRTYGSGNALRGPQGTTGERKPYERSAPRSSNRYEDKDKRPTRSFTDRGDKKPSDTFPKERTSRASKSFGDRTDAKPYQRKRITSDKSTSKKSYSKKEDDGLIRLNKYLGNAGIASRREADELIKTGAVTVNGKVITEMGHKINADDVVLFGGDRIRNEKKVYVLLNKPKDYITTTEDEKGRRTVMDLLDGIKENIFPVGRLDRNTTGLLLFTNDGDLANMLTHPKFGIRKIYSVELNKNLKTEDYKRIHEGLELEDGVIKVDNMSFVGDSKKDIGIEIHSGRNRIVRRIFESLGYEVLKLDRVGFAGLSKKDLPRGKFRFLNEKEVGYLRMLG